MGKARNALTWNQLKDFPPVAGDFHATILAHPEWAKSANGNMRGCLGAISEGL